MEIEDIQILKDGKIEILFVDERVNPVVTIVITTKELLKIVTFFQETYKG